MSYRSLQGQVDAWFEQAVVTAGPGVVLCRRGCSACCMGPFDISPADAELVAEAVDRLDPAVRSLVQLRATEQVALYAVLAPGWSHPWDIDAFGDRPFDRLSDALAGVPCPALGDDGACLIYDDRPATCRMIGLAMFTPEGGILENACPILQTSDRYAALAPALFDLEHFESSADEFDTVARDGGWVCTTVAGAIVNRRDTRGPR
jgi:Fe-S-cluster containining protein